MADREKTKLFRMYAYLHFFLIFISKIPKYRRVILNHPVYTYFAYLERNFSIFFPRIKNLQELRGHLLGCCVHFVITLRSKAQNHGTAVL